MLDDKRQYDKQYRECVGFFLPKKSLVGKPLVCFSDGTRTLIQSDQMVLSGQQL